jgi:hypothetical protein
MPGRTLTEPLASRRMWRKVLKRCHPDHGGDDDLFIWVSNVYERLAGDAYEPPRAEYVPARRSTRADSPRLDFDEAASFSFLTDRALRLAEQVDEPYRSLLRLLDDCEEVGEEGGSVSRMQHVGATFKSLAALGHKAGMDGKTRSGWYEVAQAIPLSQRHCGYIHKRLAEQEDAA